MDYKKYLTESLLTEKYQINSVDDLVKYEDLLEAVLDNDWKYIEDTVDEKDIPLLVSFLWNSDIDTSKMIFTDGIIPCSFFFFNRNLKTIKIPSYITKIGCVAFYECESLTSVYIPEGVTSIDEQAFEGCLSLESIIIPSSVTFLGHNVFYRCDSLYTINYSGTRLEWLKIKGIKGIQQKVICSDGEL